MKNNDQLYKCELIDLFKRIDSVFLENGISYFAIFGTCIGALRDGKIIPWDDDIDLAVFREDFERAITCLNSANKEIVAGTSLELSCGPRYYGRAFNRIKQGCSIEKRRAFVDIFIIDKADDLKFMFVLRTMFCVGLRRIIQRRESGCSSSHPLLYLLADIIVFPFRFFSSNYVHRIRNKVYLAARGKKYIRITGGSSMLRYMARDFSSAIRVPFYDTTIAIPSGFDEFLTHGYGDWRTPPPVELRVGNAINESGDWNVQLPKDEERMA